jgi:prepilin-type N-terminal cleavage/methylation domain-containing protein
MQGKSRAGRPAGDAGFSLIEALIAAAILLIIAMGMIPLFKRSIDNNALGNDYTQGTSYAKSDLEDLIEIPMQSTDLVLPNAATDRSTVNYVQKGSQTGTPVRWQDWVDTAVTGQPVIWTRTTRLRQFGVSAYDDGILDDAEALPGGTEEAFVQIKEVSASLDSGKATPGRRGGPSALSRLTFQMMKPF